MESLTITEKKITADKKQFAILVVDDERAIIDVIQGSLYTEGFISDKATDGNQALEAIEKRDYDLVITDIRMPGMTGVEVAETINSLNEKTKVIFVTGYAEYDTVLQAIKTHPLGYLEKPFTPNQIIELVNQAFTLWCEERRKNEAYHNLEKTVQEKESDLEFQNERLLAEKELMQGVISQANFGLIAVDTNQTVHILNKFAIDVLVAIDEFTEAYHGLPLNQVIGESDLLLLQSLFDRTLEKEELCEVNNIDPETERERHIISYPIKFRGRTTAVVFVIHDITEKQILQKRLLQSAKLASIGELAAGVAHEINNPLGFVTSNCNRLSEYWDIFVRYCDRQEKLIEEKHENNGSSGMIARKEKIKEEFDIEFIREDTQDLLDETRDGLSRVSKIVRDLKSFARVDDDIPEEHDPNGLIDDALNLVRNEIKYKLEVKKDYAELKRIQCFPNQLVQVFTNMFINASHAVEKKGLLKITTAGNDSLVKITISDNGCGIPEKVLPKIFDPFFTTKDQGKGTGMGLSISYGIIEKHGGKIEVDSTPGKGTTFTITLPYNRAEVLGKDSSDSATEQG